MPYNVKIIRLLEKVEPAIKEVLIEILAEIERQRKQWEETVTKTEFNELKGIVFELAEAQRNSEKRLIRLEETVNELAEAQKRTEEELRKLIIEHRKTRQELGALSHTVGYVLEDRAYEGLPYLLKRDFGIEVEELKREYVEISPNRYEEINIIGKGKRDGTPIWILGDCKSQLKKRDINSFLKRVSRIEHLFPGERVLITVTYQTSPQVRRYIKEKGLKLYFSYQLRPTIKP